MRSFQVVPPHQSAAGNPLASRGKASHGTRGERCSLDFTTAGDDVPLSRVAPPDENRRPLARFDVEIDQAPVLSLHDKYRPFARSSSVFGDTYIVRGDAVAVSEAGTRQRVVISVFGNVARPLPRLTAQPVRPRSRS